MLNAAEETLVHFTQGILLCDALQMRMCTHFTETGSLQAGAAPVLADEVPEPDCKHLETPLYFSLWKCFLKVTRTLTKELKSNPGAEWPGAAFALKSLASRVLHLLVLRVKADLAHLNDTSLCIPSSTSDIWNPGCASVSGITVKGLGLRIDCVRHLEPSVSH